VKALFKVRCKFVSFLGDAEKFPCHFGYKEGDEIYYDGMKFTGNICPGLMSSMMPVVLGMFLSGNRYCENIMYRYRGPDAKDPSMKKYDGVGFRPIQRNLSGGPSAIGKIIGVPSDTEKPKAWHCECADMRTLAQFAVEVVDLSDSEYAQPFYRRGIAILEKIEAEPGIAVDTIRDRFTEFEKNEISPRLTPVFLQVMLDALVDVNYIEIRDGKAYPTGKEPPSRPEIG
jgi:uncharacterized repeat protein (TIGR04076 family)